MPSTSDVAKVDDIELQEIAQNVARRISLRKLEGESSEDLPMHELVGLDKQLRSIWGSLRVKVAKKVQLEGKIDREKCKPQEIRENPEYDDGIREDIRRRIVNLNDDLSVRQESIDLLKVRLKDQITSFKETIAKVLDKYTLSAEKIRTLFREQGITIASIITAIGMAIGVLFGTLLPGGSGSEGGGGNPPPKDKKGLKKWTKNKLKPCNLC